MKYLSTRNSKDCVSASQGMIRGLSKDGGLYVPQDMPKLDDIESLLSMDYQELAYEIMSRFFTDFSEASLRCSIDKAYGKKFIRKEITPLVKVEELFFLELFYGVTLAFKDIALSILPHLFQEAVKNTGEKRKLLILTATSGDTGKAALENFANIKGIKIIVFFPQDGVSPIQKKQMLTQEGDNTYVVSIRGNFDDAQSAVKAMMNHRDFIELLSDNDYRLTSANSINIGRLIPQVVYYYHSYLSLLKNKEIIKGERINFVVPTGNFGNILAAYYAKKMGLPIKELICASNENNVLTDFLNTGVYNAHRQLKLTSSPSMDILISSNVERLLFSLSGEDDALVRGFMEDLDKEEKFEGEGLDFSSFKGYFSTEKEVSASIKELFDKTRYLMDPHTAVAYSSYQKYKVETKDKTKTVILSTASPFKFGRDVANALGIRTKDKGDFAILKELGQKANLDIPESILNLKDKAILHNRSCSKDATENMILDILGVDNEHN